MVGFTKHCSVFQFCTTHSLLSLSYHLLTVISIVIIFLATCKQVSALKAINVIEHNDCLLSYLTINIQIRSVRLGNPPATFPPPQRPLIWLITTSTTTFYLNTSIFIKFRKLFSFQIYFFLKMSESQGSREKIKRYLLKGLQYNTGVL